jgi:DNA-binding LacI/PurR family transcriptional regulator
VLGNLEALAARGIDTSEVPIFETCDNAETVEPALAALFSGDDAPTALLAHSDVVAMIALDWLTTHGLKVPEDVSIVGFDGVPETAMTSPPLTTIAQPIGEIGRRAVKTLLDYENAEMHQQLETELVIRGSTAPPPRRA